MLGAIRHKGFQLTALRRAEVLARSRGARADTASLLDVQGAALDDLTAQTLDGGISHVRGDHLDETEAARLARVGVLHDLALLDLAVLLEEAGDLGLLDARVDAGDEEVGARVEGALVVLAAAIVLDGSAAAGISGRLCEGCTVGIIVCSDVPVVGVGGHGAAARVVAVIATRRRTTVAVVARAIVWRWEVSIGRGWSALAGTARKAWSAT
jgi:hypothetical protein